MHIAMTCHGHSGDRIHAGEHNGSVWIDGLERDARMQATLFVTPDQARQIIDVLEGYATPKPKPAREMPPGDWPNWDTMTDAEKDEAIEKSCA